ncbi:MAG: hypothetical protein ABIP79_07785 [Chitinophagaceae bacterium]
MERIELLINKLKEQFGQNADPALLLGTVQLLQFELTKLKSNDHYSLGTPKVAVVLPSVNVSTVSHEEHEKYAPKPAEKNTEVKEVKETILVDNGSVSVIQKNGQLDMTFDPMKEIPTLSHQPKEINDSGLGELSMNDRLKQLKPEIVERLKETPVKDLRKAVGINDRFHFINELFRGDENMYERCIKTINSFSIYVEAEYWITRELKVKLGWNNENTTVQHFDQLVKRRFS